MKRLLHTGKLILIGAGLTVCALVLLLLLVLTFAPS
jgi:hypothetical protein